MPAKKKTAKKPAKKKRTARAKKPQPSVGRPSGGPLKRTQYERFAQEIAKGQKSGKDCAIAAGYSARTAESKASHLSRIVKVQERIRELQDKAADKTIMAIRERKQILTELGRGCLTDYQEMSPDGDVSLSYNKDSPNPRAALEVTEQMVCSDDTLEIRQKKIKLHSPVKAIQELNKMEHVYSPVEGGTGLLVLLGEEISGGALASALGKIKEACPDALKKTKGKKRGK